MPVGEKAMNTLQTSCTPQNKQIRRFLLLIFLLILAVLGSLCFGAVPLDLPKVLHGLLAGNTDGTDMKIFLHSRLPRTLAALIIGAALAASGTVLQTVLNNTLASPGILGINSGAGFGVLFCAAVFPAASSLLPAAAFLGALGASLLIYAIAARTGAKRTTIILSGIAVGSMLSAGSDAISLLFPDRYMDARTFFIGGLSGVTLQQLHNALPYILIGLCVLLFFCSALDLLLLGEDTAKSLGLRVETLRFVLLILASLLAGAAVSLGGLIGFIGLIIPHAARALFGNGHKALLPASILMGGLLAVFCDLLSRILFAPYELPMGILLSFLGGPFFLYLLLGKRRRHA